MWNFSSRADGTVEEFLSALTRQRGRPRPHLCYTPCALKTGISIRGYRTGFLFVVMLLGSVAGFTLWNEVRTNKRIDVLVGKGLQRASLIATIRVDAVMLQQGVAQHIKAATPEQRQHADKALNDILTEVKSASERYTRDLPPGEVQLWQRFNDASNALVTQVRTARQYSKRQQAERAQKHLEEEVKPIASELEKLATELTRKNREETQELLRELEALRLRTTGVGAFVAVLAVVVALGVGWRVTSVLRRQEKVILDQMAELDRRNQELDAFASRVAHDLVSPLAPLRGYLTLARRAPAMQDPQVAELLQHAEESSGRMAEFVEALLRFCRAGRPSEAGGGELDTAVSTILLEVSQSAAAQNVKLERQLDEKLRVGCPAQLLQSIARNLLSNAVKYTAGRPDAKVTVRAFRDRGQAVLEVSDNGVGMAAATQQSLFQPFFRAPEARALPGHGLGMATTRRLIEAHGGTISVHSELNVGTQVTVRLPLADAHVPRTAPADAVRSPPLVGQ